MRAGDYTLGEGKGSWEQGSENWWQLVPGNKNSSTKGPCTYDTSPSRRLRWGWMAGTSFGGCCCPWAGGVVTNVAAEFNRRPLLTYSRVPTYRAGGTSFAVAAPCRRSAGHKCSREGQQFKSRSTVGSTTGVGLYILLPLWYFLNCCLRIFLLFYFVYLAAGARITLVTLVGASTYFFIWRRIWYVDLLHLLL